MTEIYKKALELQAETEVEIEYHIIVNMIIRYGYNKTLLILIGG